MDFYLSAFGLHNPFISSELPEYGIYPIGLESTKGIDLDYTSLLLGNRYFIDRYAYEYITDSPLHFLNPMSETLKILKKEGLLEVIEVSKMTIENHIKINTMVNSLSKDYLSWLKIIRNHWNTIKGYYWEFQNEYGSSDKRFLNTTFFPVYNYLHKIDELDNTEKYKRLMKIFESSRTTFKSSEIEEIIEISKPLLGQVVINDLVHNQLKIPILNWNDSRPYYDKLNSYRWAQAPMNDKEKKLILEAQRLFDVVVPSLKPNSINEVIKFVRKDRAVNSLRNELSICLEEGKNVSKDWLIEYQANVYNSHLAIGKKMKKFKWVGAVLGTVIPGSSILQEFLIEAGIIVAEDVVEESGIKKDITWYLALQTSE